MLQLALTTMFVLAMLGFGVLGIAVLRDFIKSPEVTPMRR
jgi:hypothetical protein